MGACECGVVVVGVYACVETMPIHYRSCPIGTLPTVSLLTGMRGLCMGLGPALFGLLFYLSDVSLSDNDAEPMEQSGGNFTTVASHHHVSLSVRMPQTVYYIVNTHGRSLDGVSLYTCTSE